jgi:uncharacterized membrane protein
MTKSIEQTADRTGGWTGKDWLLLAVNAVIVIVMYAAFYHRLPDVVTSHYNYRGEPDDTMQKWSMWLGYAVIGIGLPALLSLLRYLDPRKVNYVRFEGYYHLMRWVIALFLHGVFLLVCLDNLGYSLPVSNLIAGGMGLLWILIGNRMGQLRSNFFVGIRTPWTLTDEDNWRKTHRISGRLWVAVGLIMLVGSWLLSNAWLVTVLIVCAAFSALIPFAYSYMLFARSRNKAGR